MSSFFRTCSCICMALSLSYGQELVLSSAAKTYTPDEKVWVNISVVDAATIPGAYNLNVTFDPDLVTYSGLLPSEKGPFTITPAASVNGGVVTVAGFQGISDTGNGATSLVTLLFTPVNTDITVAEGFFTVSASKVFTPHAEEMNLTIASHTASVRLPASAAVANRVIITGGNYIKFRVPQRGETSVRVFDMKGRTVAFPLKPTHCPSGYQAVPIGTELGSGIYIVAIRGTGLKVNRKMEVLR